MKNIILFDTSVGSLNQGDNIIMKAIREQLGYVLDGSFVITMPTHNPTFLPFQEKDDNKRFVFTRDADYKFICGTNILYGYMKEKFPNWNVYSNNCKAYSNSVLVGAGSTAFHSEENFNKYTHKLYQKILSHEFVHSTRDERTERILKNMGFNAINTGCPTTWFLTKEFCKKIKTTKSDNVIFTFTDYLTNEKYDQLLVDKLLKLYEHVYFWPQGSKDYVYLKSLKNTESIQIVSPDIVAYDRILSAGNIDYIGTRLHAGLFAMQHKVRSLIIGVDNRSKDMTETHDINYIERAQLEEVDKMLCSEIITDVNIPTDRIEQWKKQFSC